MNELSRISEVIVAGQIADVTALVEDCLRRGASPREILDRGLIAGMNEVGIRFKAGEMYLPEVLVSAKAMKAGMNFLRPLLIKDAVEFEGTIVLGTVKGDVHDIGKNLVGMMFEGAGYRVADIGVDQPSEHFLDAVRREAAQVVAMSALLTTTMTEMAKVIDACKRSGLRNSVKVIVGGAPLSEAYALSIGADGYAPDAASAVDKLKELLRKPPKAASG